MFKEKKQISVLFVPSALADSPLNIILRTLKTSATIGNGSIYMWPRCSQSPMDIYYVYNRYMYIYYYSNFCWTFFERLLLMYNILYLLFIRLILNGFFLRMSYVFLESDIIPLATCISTILARDVRACIYSEGEGVAFLWWTGVERQVSSSCYNRVEIGV